MQTTFLHPSFDLQNASISLHLDPQINPPPGASIFNAPFEFATRIQLKRYNRGDAARNKLPDKQNRLFRGKAQGKKARGWDFSSERPPGISWEE